MNQKLTTLFLVLVTTLTTLPALAQTTRTYQPVYREFKDWVVGCDNTGSCTVQSANEQNEFEVSITRKAGAKGRLQIVLTSLREEKQQYTVLSADGKPIRADKKYWLKNDYEWQSENTAYILALIDTLKNSSHLQWSENYQQKTSISLQGLTASLLFVDDRQKRINTPSAFIQRGNQSESNIPAAAVATKPKQWVDNLSALNQNQVQQLVQSVRKTHAKLLKEEECLPANESTDDADRLNEQEALVSIECWRGAYNSSSFIFRTPINAPEKSTQLILNFPGSINEQNKQQRSIGFFTNASYDRKTRTVSMYGKGRGLGDCGESGSWQFDGKQFNIISWDYMGVCGGSLNWLPLWRHQ